MAKGILYEKEEPRPGSSQPRRTFSPGRCTNLAHAMALAFLGDPPVDQRATEAVTERGEPRIVYCSANHIDTDKLNDILENIRWEGAWRMADDLSRLVDEDDWVLCTDVFELLQARTAHVTPSLQDRWTLTDIGGLEGLAAVCGVLFLTSVSSATDFSIYVDNMEIASNLVSGYSSREVLVCLMLEFYLQIAARPGSLWVEWVPSEANIADIPSRHPFETDLAPFVDAPELKSILGAANRRPFVFPTHSSLWTALPPASLASAGGAGGTGLPGGKEGFEPEPPGPQTGASP